MGIVVVILLLVVFIVAGIAKKNVSAMNNCVDAVLTEISKNYTVTLKDVSNELFHQLSFDVCICHYNRSEC